MTDCLQRHGDILETNVHRDGRDLLCMHACTAFNDSSHRLSAFRPAEHLASTFSLSETDAHAYHTFIFPLSKDRSSDDGGKGYQDQELDGQGQDWNRDRDRERRELCAAHAAIRIISGQRRDNTSGRLFFSGCSGAGALRIAVSFVASSLLTAALMTTSFRFDLDRGRGEEARERTARKGRRKERRLLWV